MLPPVKVFIYYKNEIESNKTKLLINENKKAAFKRNSVVQAQSEKDVH